MLRLLLALSIISFSGAALAADAQGQAGTIVQPPPNPPPPQMLQTQMGPMSMALAGHHDVRVNVLSTDTFVVVKDVGDSQVVMVYRVDQHGKVQLLHRARFYY
ncbi:MAG: hypothetical protein IT381_29620 [Deltaproteobacteria bacterium]|nr:hypothetical protein [Deltaproteobacteria bacterium]